MAELGLASGKTHSSSLEEDEAAKVRAHFERGTAAKSAAHGSTAASRAPQGITPKIDLSHISKPGDVLKAIQAKKKEEEDTRLGRAPRVTVGTAAKAKEAPAATARPAPAAKVPVAAPPAETPARPAPRKIVPQPRAASAVVAAPPATPAIASKPPAGPVVAKAPAGSISARPVVVVAPPAVAVVVKPPAATKAAAAKHKEEPAATVTIEPAAVAVTPGTETPAPVTEDSVATVSAESATQARTSARRTQGHTQTPSPTRALPARRMVMPQTGPRPVYTAPPVDPNAPVAPAGGLQRGKPIFDRRPSSGPGSYQRTGSLQRPANSPAVRVLSIPLAPRPAAIPATRQLRAHVPVLARVPALHHAQAVSAVHVPAQAAHRPPAKHPVRSVLLHAAAAVARSTPKPKKAQ